MVILISLIAVAAAAFYGGWEWALLSLVVVTLCRLRSNSLSILATIGVSALWLAIFHSTGDRRLFFPFAIQFAVQMPYLLKDRVARPVLVGGGGMIAIFMLIRISQSATVSVLLVELVVAVIVLALVQQIIPPSASGAKARMLAGMLGSTLAFAGLVL